MAYWQYSRFSNKYFMLLLSASSHTVGSAKCITNTLKVVESKTFSF